MEPQSCVRQCASGAGDGQQRCLLELTVRWKADLTLAIKGVMVVILQDDGDEEEPRELSSKEGRPARLSRLLNGRFLPPGVRHQSFSSKVEKESSKNSQALRVGPSRRGGGRAPALGTQSGCLWLFLFLCEGLKSGSWEC